MNQVRAFFLEEASECLDTLEQQLSGPDPDPTVVHGAMRQLRGSAQVARFGALAAEAGTLERVLKPVAQGTAAWDTGLARQVWDGTMELARAVDAVREGRMEQDEREPPMEEQERSEAAEAVPIEQLEYQGESALARAQELREPLEDAIVAGDPPGAILDELFDLIRLGTK
jgi:chemotaxis protein histidine kinase CheA